MVALKIQFRSHLLDTTVESLPDRDVRGNEPVVGRAAHVEVLAGGELVEGARAEGRLRVLLVDGQEGQPARPRDADPVPGLQGDRVLGPGIKGTLDQVFLKASCL